MKIFKNRGDIYIPKSGKDSTREAKVLYSLLAVIVVFTVAFVFLLSRNYKTAAEFFGEGEVSGTPAQSYNEQALPQISGKTNYLIIETDESSTILHYIVLVQADKDLKSYKAAALSNDMNIDGKSIKDIYSESGGAGLQKSVMEYFSTEIDYYAEFETSSMDNFVSKLGKFSFEVPYEINFSGGTGEDKYTLRIKAGKQQLEGRDFVNLMRYYAGEVKDYSAESELILRAFTGLVNSANYDNKDNLFKLFVKSCKTNITIRDFENNSNSLLVFAIKNESVNVYPIPTEYDSGNIMAQSSAKAVKGSFSK